MALMIATNSPASTSSAANSLSRRPRHLFLLAFAVLLLAGAPNAATPIQYRFTFPEPEHHWMQVEATFPDLTGETLELRMSRAGENAAKVCEFLRDHPKVEKVGYLGFLEEGSRQADIYNRHCTGAGSTFSLYLKGGEKEAFAFLDNLSIAHLAVSLGGTETLASAPAAMTHLSVPDERKKQLEITDNLVRISIGVEDPDDLVADFENALRAV